MSSAAEWEGAGARAGWKTGAWMIAPSSLSEAMEATDSDLFRFSPACGAGRAGVWPTASVLGVFGVLVWAGVCEGLCYSPGCYKCVSRISCERVGAWTGSYHEALGS